jgi:prepilin-type N-terminal cleavage/methylation domain-containing protein
MSPARRHGFTLIELLVVMAILGLMGMLAIPSSRSASGDHKLDLVELQMRDALNRAMALARNSRSTHAVVFDTSSNRFAVVDSAGSAVVDPLTRRPFVVEFARPDQPSGIDIQSASFGANGTAAIFNGLGLPVESGTVSIAAPGASRTLALNKATGKFSAL